MPSMLTFRDGARHPRIAVEIWSDKDETAHVSVEENGTCWCDPVFYACGDGEHYHVVHRKFEN